MTRREFTEKSEAIDRAFGWYLFVCLAGVLATMLAEAFLPELQGTHGIVIVQNVMLSIFGLGGLCGMVVLPYWLAKKSGVICPACKRTLTDKVGKTARITGTCPKCKSELFLEDAHPCCNQEKRPRLTKEQFKAQAEEFRRKSTRCGAVWLIMVLSSTLAAGWLGRHIQTAVDQGRFDQLTPQEILWIARGILVMVTLSMLCIPLLVATNRNKTGGVPCPECRWPLFGRAAGVALEKGICVYCGCRLFEGPPSQVT